MALQKGMAHQTEHFCRNALFKGIARLFARVGRNVFKKISDGAPIVCVNKLFGTIK